MSVRFWTGNARGLLYAFEQAVHVGDIATWSQNADRDFTHKSEHLKNKALLRPKVYSDSLAFAIIQVEGIEVTGQLYGMFQACIIQSFLTHLSARFTLADASSGFRDRDGDLGPSTGGSPTILSLQRADFFPFARETRARA